MLKRFWCIVRLQLASSENQFALCIGRSSYEPVRCPDAHEADGCGRADGQGTMLANVSLGASAQRQAPSQLRSKLFGRLKTFLGIEGQAPLNDAGEHSINPGLIPLHRR